MIKTVIRVADRVAVAEMRQRVSELGIDQGHVSIDVCRPGEADILLVLEVVFGQQEHAGFLLEGVVPGERDLEPVALDVADRRFPQHSDCHA